MAAKIVIVSGDKQEGVVGGKLSDKLVVRVTDSRDRPVEHQQVTFTPAAGQGTAVPPTATTNADGRAEAEWVLGPSAGAQQLTAKPTGSGAPENLSVTFTATATASLAAKVEKVAGDNQSAVAGNAVATPPKVKVTDAEGNAVKGVPVTFAVVTGGGSVNPSTPVNTDAEGFAAATSWTLGTTAGVNTLTATVAGDGVAGNPATFTATGTVGSAGKLAMVQQPSSTAQNGVPFAQQPRVQLQDAGGNPVHSAGIGVTAAIASGTGGTLGGQLTAITNGQGIASFSNLSITGTVGSYTLQFTNPTLTGVTSGPIQLGAGAAASIVANSTPAVVGTVGKPVTPAPSVLVRDADGNPVSGVAVTFTVTEGNGTIAPSVPVSTDANGTAALTNWTLGPDPGPNRVTATADKVSGLVSFTSMANAAPAITTTSVPEGEVGVGYSATLAAVGGDAQFTWDLDPGSPSLPAGLRLEANGVISGTPSAPADVTVRVQVTDGHSNTATQTLHFAIHAAVAISTTTLPGGRAGESYNEALAATNGKAPYKWTRVSGTLPPGLTLADSGQISGIPLTPGTYRFTVRVTDELGGKSEAELAIEISLGLVSLSKSSISASPMTIEASSGDRTASITVTAVDALNHPIPNAAVELSVTGFGNQLAPEVATTDGNGQVIAIFSSTVAESKTFTAKINGQTIIDNEVVTVDPAPASAANSSATVPGGTVGSVTRIEVNVRDAFGNAVPGANVVVTVNGTALAVSDNGGGAYTADYIPAAPGDDSIDVIVNGAPVPGSPFTSAVSEP
ncbi:MAG TPA: Ig-like domain-containing protein [Gemmatimonadales bacterium]|nr:Ig-like domain-containing protein [Gemmatimonadales bacterium]